MNYNIVEILNNFKIKCELIDLIENENICKYYVRLCNGDKAKKIEAYKLEIALRIQSFGYPKISYITEKGLICIEVMNKPLETIHLENIISEINNSTFYLPIILGKEYDGKILICDLNSFPHLLIAGASGSGKSSICHSIISSLIYGDKCDIYLIDPKRVEFTAYKNIENVKRIINTLEDSIDFLKDIDKEIAIRYRKLEKDGSRNIVEFNMKNKKKMRPYVIVIDEFSDLGDSKFRNLITGLAQRSRACGIHLILAVQRCDARSINGSIKANIPVKIACKTSTALDSRIILDQNGAETLAGNGDSLILNGNSVIRFKGTFVGLDSIERMFAHNKKSLFSRIFK